MAVVQRQTSSLSNIARRLIAVLLLLLHVQGSSATETDKTLNMAKYWVSITGLQLKSWLRYPQFMMYAVPSFASSQAASGNVFTEAREVAGIQHTLTVWKTRKDMLQFLRSGEHVKAMKITNSVASYGKTYGYESDEIPSWDTALKLWEEKGRVVYGEPKEHDIAGSHAAGFDPPSQSDQAVSSS